MNIVGEMSPAGAMHRVNQVVYVKNLNLNTEATALRRFLIDALLDADALGEISATQIDHFLSGHSDVLIPALKMDSLARMDLLVAVELEYGRVVSPVQFGRFDTLGDLVAYLGDTEKDGQYNRLNSASGDHTWASTAVESEDTTGIVRLFRRGFRFCATVAHLNKMLSSIEHRATPLQILALKEHHERGALIPAAERKFQRATSDWLNRIIGYMRHSGKDTPEPFRVQRILPSVLHMQGTGPRKEKILLVCFTMMGSRRMMIPHAVLLQHLDAERYDLLIIADTANTGFRGRVPLLGNAVGETIDAIANLSVISEYKTIRTFGCSAGSYPAVLAGFRLRADAAIGIGGRFPSERHWPQIIGMMWRTWRSARRDDTAMPVLIAYSERKRRDRAYASRLRKLARASALAIQIDECEIGHLVMVSLMNRGRLNEFLERTVLANEHARHYQQNSSHLWRLAKSA